MAERKLPQNIEAEMSVLGACFLSTQALQKVCEELTSEMFFIEANKHIFNAIYELHENKIPLDSTTVKNEIEKKVSLDSIGGVEYLSEVIDSVITAANVEYYIDIIREKALRRKLIEVSTNITTSAFDEDSDTNDIIDNAEKNIFSVTKARKAGEFKSIAEVIRNTQERLESLAKNKKEREMYDIATSRAVAPLNVLLEYLLPLVKVGGKCICMKGSNTEEIEEAKQEQTEEKIEEKQEKSITPAENKFESSLIEEHPEENNLEVIENSNKNYIDIKSSQGYNIYKITHN